MTNFCAVEQFKIAEVELVYRNPVKLSERPVVKTAEQSYDLLLKFWDINRIGLLEEFKIILLDNAASCLGIAAISKGGVTGCVADPRIIFPIALKARASALVLAHNHPSERLLLSKEDIILTQKLVNAGRCLDIAVCDHLVISQWEYMSMAEEGLLPRPTL